MIMTFGKVMVVEEVEKEFKIPTPQFTCANLLVRNATQIFYQETPDPSAKIVSSLLEIFLGLDKVFISRGPPCQPGRSLDKHCSENRYSSL